MFSSQTEPLGDCGAGHLAAVSSFAGRGSGLQGTGSDDPCLPTGDGEATSHSAPLEDRTLWFCHSDGFVIQPLALGLWTLLPGDGEHPSPSEPVGCPHPGVQGAEPPLYPESIAQSHISSCNIGVPSWELGLQSYFLAPSEPVDEPEPELQEVPAAGSSEGIQLTLPCPSWGVVGECEHGHYFAKELICNREWCPECGGDGGKAHQRRKASWLPRARQMRRMGKFVVTIPPELRDGYRDPRELANLGKSLKRSFQGHGFERGLRRWHFFGEDHPGQGLQGDGFPVFHPHLEVIVEAGYLEPGKIEAIKESVATILGVDLTRVNVHYEYTRSRRKMLHMVEYTLRPTFECWEWDQELAYNLVGFKNALLWGQWHERVWDEDKGKYVNGDWLSPAWDVPAGEPAGPVLEALAHGRCPVDGTAITWTGRMVANLLVAPWWEDLGGGYWSWTGLARDGP